MQGTAGKGAKKETGARVIEARVEALVHPALEALGLRLWDVRFEKEGPMWTLKVLVEHADAGIPMDTDTCEAASRAIDPILDEADPIEQSYCLEVGSPGLGRRLQKPAHFEAMAGQKVRVKRYTPDEEGRKELAGTLLGLAGGDILLNADGEEVAIPQKQAALVKACDDEDLFG